ncbi:MAG: ice-binding family protein, partial [Acholeplasma sp.]
SISVSGAGSKVIIDTFEGTLQMEALVLPANAADKSVTWSVENSTGSASISASGLLTALTDGTVTVKATSTSNALIFGTRTITISNQVIVVDSITVDGIDNKNSIDIFGGTLQMEAVILPIDAADKAIIWSVINGTGSASISVDGLLTAMANGTVTVKAALVSNPLVFGTKDIILSNQDVMVDAIDLSSEDDLMMIDTLGGTLQFNANVLPSNAYDKAVVWSIAEGSSNAFINENGLVTAVKNGTVTVMVTSVSNPLISASMVITISNQDILVNSISVNGQDGKVAINTFEGTLQMEAIVLPADAFNKDVIWSVENESGAAMIDENGLLTAIDNGTVIVKATSDQNPLIFGTRVITISNQEILVESVVVSSELDAVVIDVFGGTLQFNAAVLPMNAENLEVIWSIQNGTGSAMIDENGLVTALSNGTVTIKAVSVSNELAMDEMLITISNQEVLVTAIEVSSLDDLMIIDTFGGTLQFSVAVLPEDADDKSVVWSVENGTGEASIDENGLLTAMSNGTVTVIATSVSNDMVMDAMIITISNQEVLVEAIDLSSFEDVVIIDVFGGTLQFEAAVLPENADDLSVTWSVLDGTGSATIDQNGLLTAISDGTVVVTVKSNSNPLIEASMEITLSNQVLVVEPEAPVELLTAGHFTIIAKTGISTTSSSLIVGNIGVSPAAATYITGFSLALDGSTNYAISNQVVGLVYAADYSDPTPAYLTQAISDMEAAYTDAASRAPNFTELHAGDLSGQTLVGGVYKYGTDVVIYSDLILSGSAEDVWIFQISGNLTQAVSVNIILEGGALAENVFWQVAGNVAIETSAHFVGTILAMTEISLGTNASVSGKLMSHTAVTLDANIVSPIEVVDPVSLIVKSDLDAIIIDEFRASLQMFAEFMPANTTNQAVIWSVENGTGEAIISQTGLLEAFSNGTVTVKATSAVDSSIFSTFELTLSNQEVLVESIMVEAQNNQAFIDELDGVLQMYAVINPVDADDQLFTWTVENGTGEATITEQGVLVAVSDGTVIVKAVLNSNPLIYGELEVMISNQVPVVVIGGVDLGSAADFTILSKTGISATVGTFINGNIGVSPGPASYITGFSLILDAGLEYATSTLVNGNVYASDYAAPTPAYVSQAVLDMQTAYTDAAGRAPDFTELYAGDISGQTLEAGVYYWSSGLLINTELILSGDASEVWIFQVSGALSVGTGVSITLEGGALASNVYWQVATTSTLGVGAHFEGNILGMTSVIIGTNATYNGKIFAQTAVTLDANQINA